MSRLYDAAEPGLISEALLQQLVEDQGPSGETGRIARAEGISFQEVFELRLDFQNLRRIDNLWQFSNLCKLYLDNNIIEDIAGLETLTHLELLDLSFNNIKEIVGLDNLTKLRDLSLAHNLIECVRGLDDLVDLQVLSLGHNQIGDLSQTVLYLRTLPKLQSLCLRGNKFSPLPAHSDDSDNIQQFGLYRSHCIAFLPSVIYLDYQIIMEETRAAAKEQHVEELGEVIAEETKKARDKQARAEKLEKQRQHMEAYIDGLEGEEFYQTLFDEDTEADRLIFFPEQEEKMELFKAEFMTVCGELLQLGLEEAEKRKAEREAFFHSHQQALTNNQCLSTDRVASYNERKKELLAGSQTGDWEDDISSIHHDLMRLEMQLVDQLEDISKEFERNYSDIVLRFLEAMQNLMTRLRDLENEHYEALLEQGTMMLEQHIKGQLEESLPEELKPLFVDKDTLLGAINSSHDAHMLAIDNKEDKIRIGANKDLKVLLDGLTEKEVKRNRQRVTEIVHYTDLQREELEDFYQHS